MDSDDNPSNSNRAGRYLRQPTGYRAFIPEPLPPNPEVEISGELQVLLSKADRALGRLDGSIQTLPNPDLFVFMYVRKEAVLSSQIEGTQSSLQDVLAAEAKVLTPDRPQDVNEVGCDDVLGAASQQRACSMHGTLSICHSGHGNLSGWGVGWLPRA